MKKTINNNSIGIKKFRTIFGVLATIFALFFNGQTNAQVTIFTETMGTVASTTALTVHESGNGYDNDSYTMTNGGQGNSDIRISNASSGYTNPNASGGANVFFAGTGTLGFAIEGIDCSAHNTLTLVFGYRKESAAVLPTLALEYWNGSAYVAVPFTFNEIATAPTGWYKSPVISLPAGAQIASTRLRWTKSGTQAVRIDDVRLQGVLAGGPTITWNPTSLTGFSTTAPAASTSQSSDVSASGLTPASGNLTITAPSNFQVFDGLAWVTSYTIPYAGGALSANTVSARIAPSAPAGPVSGNVTAAGGGASTTNLAVSGTVIGPVITIVSGGTPNKFHANQGQYSDAQLITVSGSTLSVNTTITAPANFEVSITSATTGFASTVDIITTPSYTNVNVWVRIAQAAAPGVYAPANVTFASTGATTQNVSVNGQKYPNTVAFTPGNILTLRLGDGTLALSSGAQPVFLDEFTPSGVFVQTLAMPMTDFGANKRFCISGTSTSDGVINLSPDGKYLTLTGYNATNIYQATITSSTIPTNQRLVALVDYNGTVNTSTRLNAYSANNIRGGVTVGGAGFWTTGPNASPGNLSYVPFGDDGTGVVSINATWNCRSVAIANSNLYISRQADIGIVPGLPTVAAPAPTALITGLSDAYNFVVLDVDAGVSGPDLIYIADIDNGILKYSFNGTTWTARGTRPGGLGANSNCSSITVKVIAANNIEIYVNHDITVAGNTFYKVIDNAAFNANITDAGVNYSLPANLIATASANTIYRSVAFAPIFVATPEVAHTFTSPAPATAPQGSINKALYRIQCDITEGNAILTDVTVQTAGAYSASDIINFRLIVSNDATLDGGDNVLSTISTSTGPGQTLAFTGLGQNLPVNTSRYLFVTASIAGCAVLTNTINITSTPLTAINYSNGSTVKTGTPAAGSTYTISAGNLADVTSLAAASGAPTVAVSWVNPPSCITEVIVVAHTAPILGTPVGTYTGNTNYAVAPAFPGGGKVVYNGSTSPQVISGLTPNVTYYFKVFVRFNTDYSLGVQTTATPALINYYSRGSGLHTDAIWATSPTGTPATLTSLGGMLVDRGMVIQNGHTVQLNGSGAAVLVRELIVNAGGTFTASGTLPADNKFLAVYGNITNNGTIGTGTTYNPVCFNIEGISTTISGTGVTNIARIRKSFNTNATSSLIINSNVNLRFNGDGAIYNNADNTTFNVTINTGRTLTLTDATGGLSISGTDGLTGGTRNGTVTINGTLTVGGTTYARTGNAAALASIVINSGGTLNTKNLIVNTSTGNGFGFTVNGNLNISGTMTNVAGTFAPTVGGNINVSGIVLVTAGSFNPNNKLTLTSTSTATGMIDGSGAGTIIGDVTVQRRVVQATPTSNADHYLSSPVAMVGTVSSNYNDNFPVVGNPAGYVYNSNPNVTQPTVFPSTWTWDETQVNSTIPGWTGAGGTTLLAGQGFSAKIQGSKIIDIKGAPNNGAVSRTVTYTDNGLNLVGNPYPSPINFNSFATANTSTILPVLYIWNPTSNSYASYNGSIWVNNPAGALASDVIAHSQSFFVFAKPAVAPSGSVNFTNSMRTTTQAANFFATPEGLIRLEVSSNGYTDETVVMTNADATENYDEQVDAKKLLNAMNPNILAFTLSADNTPLAINALDKFNTEQVIPVQLVAPNAGEVNIKLNLADLQERYENIYLEDATLGTFVDLKARGSYTATVSAGNSGSRFFLHFEKPSIAKSVNELGVYAANSTVFVNIPSQSNGTIEVIDLVGKTIYASNFAGKSGRVAFEIPNAVYGSYIVKLTSNGKVVNQKVVLNQ